MAAQTTQATPFNALASYPQRYAVINRELPSYRTVSANMESLGVGQRSTDGGKVEAFCNATETRLLVATDYGEHGSTITNFYFWNNSLFFVQMLGFRTEGVYRGPVERTEDRLYYLNGKLVKLSDGLNAPRPLNTSEAQKLDGFIRTEAASFFSQLAGCPTQATSETISAADTAAPTMVLPTLAKLPTLPTLATLATLPADTAAPMMVPAPTTYDTGMLLPSARTVFSALPRVFELATYRELVIPAGSVQSFRWEATQSQPNCHITGHVAVTNGGKRDVRVLVMPGDDYQNYVNGHEARVYFQTGNVTAVTLDVNTSQVGPLVLAISNAFSVVSTKKVRLSGLQATCR